MNPDPPYPDSLLPVRRKFVNFVDEFEYVYLQLERALRLNRPRHSICRYHRRLRRLIDAAPRSFRFATKYVMARVLDERVRGVSRKTTRRMLERRVQLELRYSAESPAFRYLLRRRNEIEDAWDMLARFYRAEGREREAADLLKRFGSLEKAPRRPSSRPLKK